MSEGQIDSVGRDIYQRERAGIKAEECQRLTPKSVRKAATSLASGVTNFHDARSEGAALGRTLAAQVRARETTSQQLNGAAALDVELELLKLAASSDQFIAEIADSALFELRVQQQRQE